MAEVELRQVTKRFNRMTALENVSFSIQDGEFFVLLGPTGAGKTTSLRVIAGLEHQDSGSVYFAGAPVDALSPAQRDVAFVFQQYSLYPTMSVYDNLAFPLRSPLRRVPEPEIRQRIGEVATILRINHLLERKTGHLSGGEMQRVSIGRAIVRRPQIFLMDEPLSNLDAKLRESLRVELKEQQRHQGSTTLFVTHDQTEALTMADRIAVLNKGRVIQIGTPQDIYDRPATIFVAQLVGTPRINLLPGTCSDGGVHVVDSTINVPLQAVSGSLPPALMLGVRPEDVVPRADGEYAGRITLIEPLGVESLLYIQVGAQLLVSSVPGMTRYSRGDELRFSIAHQRLHYFDPSGTRVASGLAIPLERTLERESVANARKGGSAYV